MEERVLPAERGELRADGVRQADTGWSWTEEEWDWSELFEREDGLGEKKDLSILATN